MPEVNRFVRRAVVASIACLAFAGAAQAASNARLLAKFQPVTRFDSAESFRPTGVETFIADSNLERYNPATAAWVVVSTSPDAPTLPTSGAGWRLNQRYCLPYASIGGLSCYLAYWSAHDTPQVVYGRVDRLATRIVLQYWYFYYDNLYSYTHTPSDFIWQSHEGDWEVVNVVLRSADDAPLYVGYSQHCLGQRRPWSNVPRWHGHHPVVYVAAGSHANYLSKGEHAIETSCLPPGTADLLEANGLALPVDYADGTGSVSGPSALGADATSVAPIDGGPNWVAFPGFWGEYEYLLSPLGLSPPIGASPVGPAYHLVWADPLGTLASWPTG
jgi:hypothetical protein